MKIERRHSQPVFDDYRISKVQVSTLKLILDQTGVIGTIAALWDLILFRK